MYVAVKGGEQAILASMALLEAKRRGPLDVPVLGVDQIAAQLPLLVSRVMAEASLFDPELAALAIKQALGDPVEAAFLLRAYRTTLPRWGSTQPIDTADMRVQRRVSAALKDPEGGQVLGPTVDYTQRLLNFDLLHETQAPGQASRSTGEPSGGSPRSAPKPESESTPTTTLSSVAPHAMHAYVAQGLIAAPHRSSGDPEPPDITRHPPAFPMPRSARLQMLARGDEGWVLGMGYATQRGYAFTHPFAGDIRLGTVNVEYLPQELDFPIDIGEIEFTECQMINQFVGSAAVAPQFTCGYGLSFGHCERKVMAMALVDRALRADEFDELRTSATQEQEFVLSHSDSVEASGFVQHLKLPHYVTFESELQLIRALRAQVQDAAHHAAADASSPMAQTRGGAHD